jgi:hypothetical protein
LRGGITCAWIGFWALTPVCGPFPDVRAGAVPVAKPPGIVPALGLSSFRHAGTTSVHSDGLDPAPNRQVADALSARPFRSWAYIRVIASTFFARQHANFPSASFGLMPGPSGHLQTMPGTGDLSEVLHLS